MKNPKISVLLSTYNRHQLLDEFIEDLMKQTFKDFELVILNNGSTNETALILEKYKNNERIRIFEQKQNLGCAGGYNFLLDQIQGEWFAILGDDDRLKHHAFEMMLSKIESIDPTIDAITANTIDPVTGKFAGHGLDHDQYLPIQKIITKTSGEFFGLTKTKLLRGNRYNVELDGEEDTFYFKIDAIANRYYIHEGLQYYGRPEIETITKRGRKLNAPLRIHLYKELLKEPFYWEQLKKYTPQQYAARCLRGFFFLRLANEQEHAEAYSQMLELVPLGLKYRAIKTLVGTFNPSLLSSCYDLLGKNKLMQLASKVFVKRYSEISN